jgi:hypothetical protein
MQCAQRFKERKYNNYSCCCASQRSKLAHSCRENGKADLLLLIIYFAFLMARHRHDSVLIDSSRQQQLANIFTTLFFRDSIINLLCGLLLFLFFCLCRFFFSPWLPPPPRSLPFSLSNSVCAAQQKRTKEVAQKKPPLQPTNLLPRN